MTVILGLFAIIIVLGWIGFELRTITKLWSRVCLTAAAFVILLLAGAFFGLYGA